MAKRKIQVEDVAATVERDADEIPVFCARHGISRSTFYNMLKSGTAPRVMRVGTRIMISREAAADWRRACENAAPAQGAVA